MIKHALRPTLGVQEHCSDRALLLSGAKKLTVVDIPPSRSIDSLQPKPSIENLLPRSHVVLYGENDADYSRIEAQILGSVKPEDFFEQIWVRDIADLVWEALRLRRMKGNIIQAEMLKIMDKTLYSATRTVDTQSIIRNWLEGVADGREYLENCLSKINASIDTCYAEALTARLPDLERLDRLVASAESRRNTVLKEINLHREVMATRLAQVAAAIEDAEFAEVPTLNRQRPIIDGQST